MKQEIHFCTAPDGVRVAYATTGAGPPLVRAAHWLTHLAHDLESPVWCHWIRDLSRHHTLVRYDLRGSGLSDREVDDLSFAACVSDLEAVVDALHLQRFGLLGPSEGAAVAIAYAVRHPGRVSRLVLYGGFARGRSRRTDDPRQIAETELLLNLVRGDWGRDNPAFRQLLSALFLPEGTPEELRSFSDLQRYSVSAETALRVRSTFYSLDVSDLATLVRVPTLILHARHDGIVPFEEAGHLAALIPGSRLIPLAGENHLLRDGEPAWLTFLEEVRAFLSSPSGEPENGAETGAPVSDPEPLRLTRRECEVLELIAQGRANPEIATRLCISPKTLEKHISNLFRKLEVRTRAQAIVHARSAGFGAAFGR